MPIDYKKYPDNWKLLRHKILERADNCCELCFAPNNVIVHRNKKNGQIEFDYFLMNNLKVIRNMFKKVKIILTIHHIDGDIKNNDEKNLIALCQRCHIKLDVGYKLKKRRNKK